METHFMKRWWLLFAQAVTVGLAALFVLQTLKPGWMGLSPTGPAGASALPTGVFVPRGGPQPSFADAVQRALPAVVYISTSQEMRQRHPLFNDPLFRRFFGAPETPQRSQGLGSGVIVSDSGYILTNNHVIEAADDIEVATSDGQKFKAKLVGADPESDLAVVKITPGSTKLPVITFAPNESLRIGDNVLAMGNPFGVGQTVTAGIVSALGRSHLGINTFENFIQTDAAINPGNSGGALIDAQGQLVGINTAIYSESGGSMGIGFAIPVSLVRNVMEQIIRQGGVTRGWVGIEVQEMTKDLAESFGLKDASGAIIAGVVRNGPAERAGVRPGDVLLAVNDQSVKDAQETLAAIAGSAPGSVVRLQLRRNGESLTLPVTAAKRPLPKAS
jgi:serine protease DegQ